MTDLPDPTPIRELGPVDADAFQEIRKAGKPAVFRGLAAEWPAVQAALQGDAEIVAYLKRFAKGSRPGVIVGEPEIRKVGAGDAGGRLQVRGGDFRDARSAGH